MNRRHFFARVSGTAAALSAASLWDVRLSASSRASDSNPRRNEAFRIRSEAAQAQRLASKPRQTPNGDEARYASRIASFTKALPHDPYGEVDPVAYAALLHAMQTGDPADFAAIPMGGSARLVNPQAALAFDFVGADSHAFTLRAPPAFASAEEAAEMVELYWQALTRDLPFSEYSTSADTAAAAAELSALRDFRGPKVNGAVTPSTLFRGPTAGDRIGPYISQLLWKPVVMGPYTLEQRVRVASPFVDYMTTFSAWADSQSGRPAPAKQYEPVRRFIISGRDLAEYVHRDFTYQAFQNAALVLMASGAPLAAGNPYHGSNQVAFASFGGPQILDCVAFVALLALHAAWYQKWSVHRRLRPEAFAGCLEANTMGRGYRVHDDVLASGALARVIAQHGTRLLPMAYPEGCPVHPAYPAGHAAIAGACTTMLKAFFDTSAAFPGPVQPSFDGSALEGYTGPALTVGGELDKLASNIAIGRDTAGVHWRSDGEEGLRLGEQVAIAALRDMRLSFNESFAGFTFRSFDGTLTTVA